MKWLALVVVGIVALSYLYEEGANTLAILVNNWKLRHEGRNVARVEPSSPVGTARLDVAGSPDTVDTRNGGNVSSLTDGERDDIRRLAGLVEFHRVPEGVVPPNSRVMRRTIH